MASSIDLEALIIQYKKGSRRGYNQFVSLLANPATKEKDLLQCLTSLRGCVTLLNKEHEYMVGVALTVDWTSKSEGLLAAYQSFVLNLIAVQTDYLPACLRMIIKHFMPALKPGLDKTTTSLQIDEESVKLHNQIFLNIHNLLKGITNIVPMCTKLLLQLLSDMYPYLSKAAYLQECYLKNLFEVTLYLPDLRLQILELIIDKLLKLDVRAPRKAVMESSSAEDSAESGVFTMEEGGDSREIHFEGHVLDVLLTHLFRYLQQTCFTDGLLQWEHCKRLYREMLYVFEKLILPTLESCHVQFTMFYLASLKPDICDGFLDFLWKLVQNPNQQAVYRQLGVSYIGSLLARGKYVSLNTMMKMMELMIQWAHSYIANCEECVMADVTHHGPFYSVCQTIFYVFSFRQKEIFETKKGFKWAERLQLQHLIQCRLNPLKVCFPIIVKTFASITRQHQLVFCDHIIQQNNRSFLPVVSNGTQKLLESFFPFDPYALKISSQFIDPIYREYDQTAELDDGSADEDEDDDDDDEMFMEDIASTSSKILQMATTPGSLVDKADVDLMRYGVSPGFKN